MNTFERRKFMVNPEGEAQEQELSEAERTELQKKTDVGKKRLLQMRDGKLGYVSKDEKGNEIFKEAEPKEHERG